MSRKPILYVEGRNDEKALSALLKRNAIDTEKTSRRFDIQPVQADDEGGTESVDVLLAGIREKVRRSVNLPVGFVLDADADIQDRWNSVCSRLSDLGVQYPKTPASTGFIADVPNFKTKVGVWLMPNNRDKGMLEDFLHELIEEGDKLLPIAKEATKTAFKADPRFAVVHEPKAVIHSWLAWQEKPGLPFGTAITAHYFRHDTEVATAFVKWFRDLFGV